jgi:hypothetical protein
VIRPNKAATRIRVVGVLAAVLGHCHPQAFALRAAQPGA